MTKLKISVICAGLFVAGVLPALGAEENGVPGTGNYFTPAQRARAFAAATQAGYTPNRVDAFQDGNFFLGASRAGQNYQVTVVPSGQVYPSKPATAAS